MWLLKFFYQRRKQSWRLPPISRLTCGGVFCISVLFWYPSISTQQSKMTALEQQRKALEKRRAREAALVKGMSNLFWLDKYDWLNWKTEGNQKASAYSPPSNAARSPVVSLHLAGQADYYQWRSVLDELAVRNPARPLETRVQWQIDNKLDVHLVLQLVIEPSLSIDLLPLPQRTYKLWPDNMHLSSTLYWQGEWRAILHLQDQDVPLVKGAWVPELSASVIELDKQGVLLRQQSFSANNKVEYRLDSIFSNQSEESSF